ncbi:mitochondrial import inner membrane translocase subunit TIM10 [Trifolium repens]|nr:mitochondrial import inner membrane translocase subunit TIM10 [Trifolium repens]
MFFEIFASSFVSWTCIQLIQLRCIVHFEPILQQNTHSTLFSEPPFNLPKVRLAVANKFLNLAAAVPDSLIISLQDTMAATGMDKDQIFGMAEKEMEYRVELFNKMTQSCFNKCVDNKYKESELNMGENSCIDRCVSKYWHVTNLIGQLLGSGRPPM